MTEEDQKPRKFGHGLNLLKKQTFYLKLTSYNEILYALIAQQDHEELSEST